MCVISYIQICHPQPGESLKDFFNRTSVYWQMAAYEHTQHTGKVLFLEHIAPLH